MSLMANYWAEKDYSIILITIDPLEKDAFEVRPNVKRISLNLSGIPQNKWQGIKNNFWRILKLRETIRDSHPEIVISFMERQNVMMLIASFRLNFPIIISERVNPQQEPVNFYWRLARVLLYRFADKLVIQTNDLSEWAAKMTVPSKIAIIPNPLKDLPSITQGQREKIVVGMGRLVHQKGFDLLIKAFANCVQNFPEWRLIIMGEGNCREILTHLISEFELESKISLLGDVTQPELILRKAEIFVLSSRWEGFPNALLEAMACGAAVISFDCPSGPAEIVQHNIDGLLVPPEDVEKLAEAMKMLMGNPEKRQSLAAKAIEVQDRFNIDHIMDKWEQLCLEVIEEKK